MTAFVGSSGPATAEGYVKYRCFHTPGPAPAHPDLDALDKLRTELFDAGLIGARPDGVGFGNLSARDEGGRFVITATGTGGARVLGPGGYCLVTAFDVEGNSVHSTGPRQASSEALSHGALYRADPATRCVVHVHSRAWFDRLMAAGAPATSADAAFGTPDMARGLEEVAARRPGRAGVAVLAGHDEGIMVYGPGIPPVAALLDGLRRGLAPPEEV